MAILLQDAIICVLQLDGYIADPKTVGSDYTVFPIERHYTSIGSHLLLTLMDYKFLSALYGAVQNTFNLNVLYGSTLAI